MYQPLVRDPLRPAPVAGLPTLRDILKAVSVIEGSRPEWIASERRFGEYVLARRVYCNIARSRKKPDGTPLYSLRQIGQVIGRSYCNVLYHLNMVGVEGAEFHARRALAVALLQTKFPDMLKEET